MADLRAVAPGERRTVGDLIAELERYPPEHYVMVLEHEDDGDKWASTVTDVSEVEGVVFLHDEPPDYVRWPKP